jgi:hypothetical protein
MPASLIRLLWTISLRRALPPYKLRWFQSAFWRALSAAIGRDDSFGWYITGMLVRLWDLFGIK